MKPRKPKIECVFPTEADLEWLSKGIQRHTGGIKAWWDQRRHDDFKAVAHMIIDVWEGGRGKADNLYFRDDAPAAKAMTSREKYLVRVGVVVGALCGIVTGGCTTALVFLLQG